MVCPLTDACCSSVLTIGRLLRGVALTFERVLLSKLGTRETVAAVPENDQETRCFLLLK